MGSASLNTFGPGSNLVVTCIFGVHVDVWWLSDPAPTSSTYQSHILCHGRHSYSTNCLVSPFVTDTHTKKRKRFISPRLRPQLSSKLTFFLFPLQWLPGKGFCYLLRAQIPPPSCVQLPSEAVWRIGSWSVLNARTRKCVFIWSNTIWLQSNHKKMLRRSSMPGSDTNTDTSVSHWCTQYMVPHAFSHKQWLSRILSTIEMCCIRKRMPASGEADLTNR